MEKLAIGILTSAEIAHFYSAFNPSIFTIRRFPDNQTVDDITQGCIISSIFGLIIAGTVAYIAKSIYPFIMSLIVIAAMDYIYISTAKNGVKKTNN